MASLLILGYGNPARGDDALGPELISRFEKRDVEKRGVVLTPGIAGGGIMPIDLLTDFQLQPEHALDMKGRDGVILVDADVNLTQAFRLDLVTAAQDASYTTHAMSPAALLWVYANIGLGKPPPCYLLRIRGYHFRLGLPLSPNARENLELAESFLLAWLSQGIRMPN